ncbi:MAG TPA: mucoidy inhibitor MuiA family protein, partial [Polyangiaceae bacterium]|nr:mucoidy inhibitor MuiA family protein [Polyangiaceae bacterium]
MTTTTTLDLACPVTHVTVFEDRARVTRSGLVALGAGTTRLRVVGVSPVLVDRSLCARVQPNSELARAARVSHARVVRERVVLRDAEPEKLRELTQRLEQLELDRAEFLQRQKELVAHIEQLSLLESRTLREFAEDVSFGQTVPEAAAAQIADLAARKRAALCRAVEVEEQGADLEQALQDLQGRLHAAQDPSAELRADLVMDVLAEAETSAELVIDYTVPNAAFRPQHTAKLDERKLTFTSDACVWQNTGEDWQDIQLRLSTERPSLGLEPPLLETDLLLARRTSAVISVEARDEKIHMAGLGASQSSDTLPGIDDGGEPIEFVAPAKATIPSDGRPYRVIVQRFEAAVGLGLMCRPELAQRVFRRAVSENASRRPLLAGPVDLIECDGLV